LGHDCVLLMGKAMSASLPMVHPGREEPNECCPAPVGVKKGKCGGLSALF
jgi:hypothetical protein